MSLITKYFSTASHGAGDGITWSDRAALFTHAVTVNSGTWGGTFVIGEVATQTGTGATANVVDIGGSGTTFLISNLAGSPNNSGVWTGAGGGTVTPTTTPANSTWSTVITGFDFSGSDSLECRIEGALTYRCNTSLATGLFANPPTNDKPCLLHGCDSSGNLLEPPDPNWVSAQPAWDDSTMPYFTNTSLSVSFVGLSTISVRMIKMYCSTGANSIGAIAAAGFVDWCIAEVANNHSSCYGFGGVAFYTTNCVIKMTGTAYLGGTNYSSAGQGGDNVRIEGNLSASSGNRNGWHQSSNVSRELSRITSFNHPGVGITHANNGTGSSLILRNCSCINNGSHGVSLTSTTVTLMSRANKCLFTGNGGYGISSAGSQCIRTGNRYRDNTSGTVDVSSNHSELSAYSTDSDDSTEFVNAAGGDFRIKYGSATWGNGYGAGDEPASGGGWGFQRRSRTIGI